MIRSRRNFLQSLGIGAAAGAVVQWPLAGVSEAVASEPTVAGQRRVILLNSNENAYGPSPKVADAIRSAVGLSNRYGYMKYDEVTERIANYHKVKPEQVLFGCGSTELLRVAACAYLGSGKQLMQAWPTFEDIQEYAKALGSPVQSVPLDPHFAHDLGRMLTLCGTGTPTGLIYICNPNNPTGTITRRDDLESFIGKVPADTHILIDEAYHDFAGQSEAYASFIDRPVADDRVIVTRTFSKVYGLAGLRIGYAVAAPKVIERMRPFLTQDGLNTIATEVVPVALDDTDGVKTAARRNRDERQEFHNQAMVRMLKPIDSHTNFLLVNTMHPADEVIEHFRKHDILIGRRFPPLDTYIRVSLGTQEEMIAFWRTWDLIPWSKKFTHH
jgi:histidinol-phosphate aminotransferase